MEHTLRTIVGERIAQERQRKGLTQLELSAKAGMHESNLNKVERAHVSLSMESLARLADALDCSTDFLLGRSNTPLRRRSRTGTKRSNSVAV